MSVLALVPLTLRALRARLMLLGAAGGVLMVAALGARVLSGGRDHVELDRIFELGGPTLASAFLLTGWIVGRFPILAALVLLAGVYSHDRATGLARLYLARPVSPLALYGIRWISLVALAFAIGAVAVPLFDIVLLGGWAGPSTFVLVAAHVVAYGGLMALLSAWTRFDAWIALLLGILAVSWQALRAAGMLDTVPVGGREFITLVLPPHGALAVIENAFAAGQTVPWPAFFDALLYGGTFVVAAGFLIVRREI